MKVFFRAGIRSKDIHEGYYRKIYEAVEALGYTFIDKYLLEHSLEDHYKKLEAGGSKAYNAFFQHEIDGIKNADVNIFECSTPSLGLGLQVEKSLESNKPTIIIYLDKHLPHFLAGVQNEKLVLKRVKEDTIQQVLKQAFEEAKQLADKRFNFFISPQLLTYLDKVAKQMGITKSTFIRSLIMDHMKKNASRFVSSA